MINAEYPSGMEAVPLVDNSGHAVLNSAGVPVQRPLRLPPSFFVQQGQMDRNIVAGLNAAGHPEEAPAYIAARLARFRQYGSWDARRLSAGESFPQFTDYATIAIGLYAAAAGLSESDVLSLQDDYASFKSDFHHATMDRTYPHLAERNVRNTRLGYRLYADEIYGSGSAP